MELAVTLPEWIVRDGAHSVPRIGDLVSYRVIFVEAQRDDRGELDVDYRVGANDRELTFPTFTALHRMTAAPVAGPSTITGRLFVDYELAIYPHGRLRGIVVDRKRLIEETLLPADPSQLTTNPRIRSQELFDVDDDPDREFAPDLKLGHPWRRPTGFVLTIDAE